METIKGNTNPKAEEKTFYELSDFIYNLGNPLFWKRDNVKHIWTLHKQVDNKWKQVSGNIKYGEKVPYTFGEKVAGIPFKIEVYTERQNFLNQIEKKLTASLVVVPRTKNEPVIGRVILLNRDNADVNRARFNESLSAEARTSNLVGKEITFYLWEEGATEEKKYQKPKTAKVDKNGIAKIKFSLSEYAAPQTWMSFFSGNNNVTKKFFVTASYQLKEVINRTPVSVTEGQQQKTEKKDKSSVFIEKATDIIAEGVGKVGDYVDGKTRTATTVGNSDIDKSIKSRCFCNRDFEEKDVRQLVKLLKGSETIWEGQALKGGKRAECNIQDKSFATLTKELNNALKKYNINTCAKKMHFLAQVTEETGTFASSEETKSTYASSTSSYKGRGLLQLTGVKIEGGDTYDNPGPYKDYANYKGDQNIVQRPEIVANNVHYCIDSGAWIWSVNKKMPSSKKSQAVIKWSEESAGKSLNELAVYEDKYLELISALLNGRNKKTGMPNGWEKRKNNYKLLKTGFFMYHRYHGDNNKPVDAKDVVTYHIFENGEIEKHIPKSIKSGFENTYKYIYHDKNDKKHDICDAEWHLTKEKNNGIKPGIKPTHSKILFDDKVSEGQTTRRVKYVNGDIAEYGSNEGVSFWVLYTVTGENIELVKMPDSLNYNNSGVIVKYSFTKTKRRYTEPGHLAVFIGALAECGFLDVQTTGSCFSEASCFPSVEHVNGKSIDTLYLDDIREQKLINAFNKFGITKQLRGSKKKAFNHTSDGKKLHNSHLHSGIIAAGKIKIIKEK